MNTDTYTFTIQWLKPFNSCPMPHVGRRIHVGRKVLEITAVRIGEMVCDAVVVSTA